MKNWQFIAVLGVVLILIGIRSIFHLIYVQKSHPINEQSLNTKTTGIIRNSSALSQTVKGLPVSEELCEDKLWCSIPMPSVSYFKFEPPKDKKKWKSAQIQAAKGEQVLLKRTIATFPNYLDFLDGDVYFRTHNVPVDIFIDDKRDLSPLKAPLVTSRRRMEEDEGNFGWEKKGKVVIPPDYDVAATNRAAVVKLGYFAFAQDGYSQLFQGPKVGEAMMGLRKFLDYWKAVKDQIQTPFIAIHSANENWGLLSTYFPNRTVDWGECCRDDMKDLMEFLDHNKTLLFAVGQHYNLTHPKVLSLPRGMPINQLHVRRMIWDTMRVLAKTSLKNQLVFTASSKWGPRPQIIACVAKKFSESDFKGVSYEDSQQGRISPSEYYRRLGSSRLGLALSGLGMDTFRLWEAMTLGTVPVVERGMGLDKTLWRLPALLVDDFDEVTPELLRTAYVEALYRADDFEFERLKQSFWWSFIANVSVTMDTRTVLDKFPPEAEDSGFMRPFVPFDCWKTNSCGKGTKRVPKSSC